MIPNSLDCVIPKKYCLEGSGKLVDVLTISAYFMPVLLVFGAYNIWRKQKSAELLAIRAQEIYTQIKDILKLLDVLDLKIKASPSTTNTSSEEYKNFMVLYEKVGEDLGVFKLLLDEEASIHCNEFNIFYDDYLRLGNNLGKIDLYRVWSGDNVQFRDIVHYQNIKSQVGIESFKRDTDIAFKLLAKIILHK